MQALLKLLVPWIDSSIMTSANVPFLIVFDLILQAENGYETLHICYLQTDWSSVINFAVVIY